MYSKVPLNLPLVFSASSSVPGTGVAVFPPSSPTSKAGLLYSLDCKSKHQTVKTVAKGLESD